MVSCCTNARTVSIFSLEQGLKQKSKQAEHEIQQLKTVNDMLLSDISSLEKESNAVNSELVSSHFSFRCTSCPSFLFSSACYSVILPYITFLFLCRVPLYYGVLCIAFPRLYLACGGQITSAQDKTRMANARLSSKESYKSPKSLSSN